MTDGAIATRAFCGIAALAVGLGAPASLGSEPTEQVTGPAYEPADRHRSPSDAVYRVRHLPHAEVRIDGRLDEPEWSRANVERHFIFPWTKAEAPATEFLAFCDDKYLYFAFRAEDADIFVLDKLRDKEDAVFEDRVEMILSLDDQMKDYFCFEIDSRGRVFDYRASYYRQFDPKWKCRGLETAALPLAKGYAVEGRIPLATLVQMGFPRLARREDPLRTLSGRVQPRPQRQTGGATRNDPQSRPQARRSAAAGSVDELGRSQDARARFPRSLVARLAGNRRVDGHARGPLSLRERARVRACGETNPDDLADQLAGCQFTVSGPILLVSKLPFFQNRPAGPRFWANSTGKRRSRFVGQQLRVFPIWIVRRRFS